jgi:Protein of unknown function (DUF1570)
MTGIRAAFGALLILAMPLQAAGKWIRLSTPNFELYTDNSEALGRETLRSCEQLRSFFSQLPDYQQRQLAPVRIVEFSSKDQFKLYQSMEWEAGHYESNGSRDWIALGPDSTPAIRAATLAHEYHHLVAARAGLRLPRWLTEGQAEFFSTLKPSGEKTQVGALIPSRLETLRRGRWLSVEALTAVDEQSFSAFKADDAELFYSESWILTHLLEVTPRYAPNFPKLVAILNQSAPPADAFQLAFGRDAGAVDKDLRSYLAQEPKSALLFPQRMDTAATPVIGVAPTTDFEVALVMADLLAVMGKDDAAKTAFDSLNRQFTALQLIQNAPEERAAPLAGMYFHLARIGWDPKQPGDALLDTLQHILDLPQVQRAGVGQASSMAEVYYQFALVANRAKAPLERVANALLLALKLEPDHLDAHVKLGEFYLDANRLSEAASAFMQIPTTPNAARYALNGLHGVAAEYLKAANFVEARQMTENGRKWIRTPADSSDTDHLLVYIALRWATASLQSGDLPHALASLDDVKTLDAEPADSEEMERLRALIEARSKGRYAVRRGEKIQRAEGTAVALDCPAAGPLLRIKVAEKEMRFDLPDPASVELSSSGAASLEVKCGPLKPFHIAVEYAVPGVTNPASAGIVRKMTF